MDIWEILEIEPTSNVAEIKKAYARKVKYCHREDNPDEWMMLHNAYMMAINSVKRYKARGFSNFDISNEKKDLNSDICNVEQEKYECDKVKHTDVKVDIEKTELNKENSVEDKIKNLYADIKSGKLDYSEMRSNKIKYFFANKIKRILKIVNDKSILVFCILIFVGQLFIVLICFLCMK